MRAIVTYLPHPLSLIQPHLVGDHRNKLRVGGLAPEVMDGVANVEVEGVHIAPVPRYLDGVADGTLHPAGGGAVALGDFRIQALGDGVDVVRLVHGEEDGVPQELVYNRQAINSVKNLCIYRCTCKKFIVLPVYDFCTQNATLSRVKKKNKSPCNIRLCPLRSQTKYHRGFSHPVTPF